MILVLNSAIETVPVPIFDFQSDIQHLLNFPDVNLLFTVHSFLDTSMHEQTSQNHVCRLCTQLDPCMNAANVR